jgi:hypothetical protein
MLHRQGALRFMWQGVVPLAKAHGGKHRCMRSRIELNGGRRVWVPKATAARGAIRESEAAKGTGLRRNRQTPRQQQERQEARRPANTWRPSPPPAAAAATAAAAAAAAAPAEACRASRARRGAGGERRHGTRPATAAPLLRALHTRRTWEASTSRGATRPTRPRGGLPGRRPRHTTHTAAPPRPRARAPHSARAPRSKVKSESKVNHKALTGRAADGRRRDVLELRRHDLVGWDRRCRCRSLPNTGRGTPPRAEAGLNPGLWGLALCVCACVCVLVCLCTRTWLASAMTFMMSRARRPLAAVKNE